MIAKAYPITNTGANEKILPNNKGRTMKKAQGNSTLSRRRIIKGAGVLAAGIAAPAFLRIRSAYAAYPERPVKIVVANTPGGPSDIVGRITAAALQQSTGKTFIIENIGGAGSNIGMGHVARSEPDGYTILLATNAYSINATLYNKIPYDPLKDFVGVCELATSPNTFVVKSELPAKTMKEFVALARANPDKFNVATPPIGTTPQLQAEVLKIREKLPKLESVVFKGGGDALQALLSGTVQLEFRRAAAGGSAHQGRHAALPGGDRRNPLARSAGRSDHGGGRLQGLRVCGRHRAAGAGQDAARERQVAGAGNAQGARHAGNEREAVQIRLPGAAEGRRRRLGARHQGNRPCSGTSSIRPASRSFSTGVMQSRPPSRNTMAGAVVTGPR